MCIRDRIMIEEVAFEEGRMVLAGVTTVVPPVVPKVVPKVAPKVVPKVAPKVVPKAAVVPDDKKSG